MVKTLCAGGASISSLKTLFAGDGCTEAMDQGDETNNDHNA